MTKWWSNSVLDRRKPKNKATINWLTNAKKKENRLSQETRFTWCLARLSSPTVCHTPDLVIYSNSWKYYGNPMREFSAVRGQNWSFRSHYFGSFTVHALTIVIWAIEVLIPTKQGRHRPQTPPPAPGVATWEVVPYTSVGLQLVLLCTLYSQAQGCVCTALQLGGDVEQPWLMSKYDVNHNRATAIGSMRKKLVKIWSRTDKNTHTDRQTRSSQYSFPLLGRSNNPRACAVEAVTAPGHSK